jgi:putative hemolysin
VIGQLHHLPETGEATEALGWRFEVIDMDGRRIDKVLATRLGQPVREGGDRVQEPQQAH